ncbi:MAG TPA: hypothetical protein PKA55_20280 [Rhodoblastus sp.]|nr:hypothetical protein [Rhodoblastus sp.]
MLVMDGNSPEKIQNIVFGLHLPVRRLIVFACKAKAIQFVEELDIAEGDWSFFAADGSPLEAHFSTVPKINHDQNTYENGVYDLRPAMSGANLLDILVVADCQDDASSGLVTLRDVEQFVIDQALEQKK